MILWIRQFVIGAGIFCLCLCCSGSAFAREYVWPNPQQDVVLGKNKYYVATGRETYAQIAAIFDVAYDNLSLAKSRGCPAGINVGSSL